MSTRWGTEREITERFREARALHDAGRTREAETAYRDVVSDRKMRDEPTHPEALAACLQIAMLMSADGRANEAANIAETTTESYARHYGLNHPETLQSRLILALVRFTQGQFAAAAALHTSVLNERERTLGAVAPAAVESRRFLAGTLARLGRAGEAEELLRMNVALATTSHQTVVARAVLADLLFQLDRLQEALAEFTAVGDIQGQAGVLFALGRYEEAVEAYRSLRLSDDDPNNWLVRVSLEHVRAARGDAESAVVEVRALLDECRTRWGAEAPVTRCALLVLGDVLLMADQPAAAVTAFDDAIEALTKTCGRQDSMTLCARHMVGAALLRVGQLDEAAQEFHAAADRDDRPPAHSCALATRQGLARVAAARGEFATAAAEQIAVVAGLTNLYGADHPNTLEARFDVADLLRQRAFPAEAEAAHRAILAARVRVLGEDHPDTRKSRAALRR